MTRRFKRSLHRSSVLPALTAAVIALALLQSCSDRVSQQDAPDPHANGLRYFGYVLVDVGFDDPFDGVAKTNYVDEVSSFTNMADLLVGDPTDDISARLDYMERNQLGAVLHVSDIFFQSAGSGGPSGNRQDLRGDYASRWNTFVATNNLTSQTTKILALYVGEEPTWNDISYLELKSATDLIKSTMPNTPVLIVEAYPSIDGLQIPDSVDWVGFDHYFIKDPENSSVFLDELARLKAKRSLRAQKIVLVLDAHYIASAHGAAGISEADMKAVATSYYDLASSDPEVIALFGYVWPGGFDDPSSRGARELPAEVIDEHRRIGKAITGKP